MRAVVITAPGGPEVLKLLDLPAPRPAADEVLVKVRASALNRADILQRKGRYPAPPGYSQEIPGLEFAGEVAEVGAAVRYWSPGHRVFGITGGGAQAELVVAHERMLAEIPAKLNFEEAAAIPEVFITAHDALWKQAQLRPSEKVLIHAVGSGVGLAAVQLTRALGAVPSGSSRTGEKIEEAKAFGLEDGAVTTSGTEAVLELQKRAAPKGFDVVLNAIGAALLPSDLAVLAPKGRIVIAGTVAGYKSELDLRPLLAKRATIIGTVLRSRPIEEKIAATQAFIAEVLPLLDRGVLRPVVDRVLPITEIAEAHRYMEANESFGKIVLRME
jgi:putative PIG3 family NAD(P)H quinone oxidoreductase